MATITTKWPCSNARRAIDLADHRHNVPGQATVSASATQPGCAALRDRYLQRAAFELPRKPDVATGDFDGDGINELAVGAFIQTRLPRPKSRCSCIGTLPLVRQWQRAPTARALPWCSMSALHHVILLEASPWRCRHGDGDEEVIVAYHENFNLSSAPKSVDLHVDRRLGLATAEALTFAFIDEVVQGARRGRTMTRGLTRNSPARTIS